MDFKAVLLPIIFLAACSGQKDEIAKIDDHSISKSEFASHLAFKRIDPDQQARVDEELERYIDQSALAEAIEKAGTMTQSSIDAEVAEFKRQMIVSRYMTEYLDKAVNEVAIENYYNGHQDEFTHSQAHVAHIIFRVHSAMSTAEQQVAQQKAREVLAKLAKGEDFSAIAEALSEDVYSAEKGGDLGWLSAEAIDPDFAKAVSELAPGETSDVVKTQYGYHIIKLLEPPRKQVAPLTQVSGDIRYQLRQKAKAAETERLMSTVKVTKAE